MHSRQSSSPAALSAHTGVRAASLSKTRAAGFLAGLALVTLAAMWPAHSQAQAPRGQAIIGQTVTEPLYRTVLHISQSALLGSATPSVVARTGPLTLGSTGYGLSAGSHDVSAQLQSARMPLVPLAGTLPQSAILSQARTWMQVNATSYLGGPGVLATYMRDRGISMAYFNVYQEVSVATTAGPRTQGLLWSGTIDADGRALYGDPRIVRANPTFLDVQFFPATPGEGVLPAENYPDAGYLVWRTLDRNLQPSPGGASGRVLVGAVFDDLTQEGETPALSCLIDARQPLCRQSGTPQMRAASSVASLVDATGAAGAFVLVARPLGVEYVEDAGEEFSPALAVRYVRRELTCTAVRQEIEVSKRLEFEGALYFATGDDYLRHSRIDTLKRVTQVNPTVYYREASIEALGAIDPSQALLSPLPGHAPQEVFSATGTDATTAQYLSSVVSVSALTDLRSATTAQTPLDSLIRPPQSFAWAMHPVAFNAAAGTWSYVRGAVGAPVPPTGLSPEDPAHPKLIEYQLGIEIPGTFPVYSQTPVPTGFHERTFTFTVADPATAPDVRLVYARFNDIGAVLVNGQTVAHSLPTVNYGEFGAAASDTLVAGDAYGASTDFYPWVSTTTETLVSIACSGQYNVLTGEFLRNLDAPAMTQVRRDARIRFSPVLNEGGVPFAVIPEASYGCVYTNQLPPNSAFLTMGRPLRPFLVAGVNTITIRTAVANDAGGVSFISLTSRVAGPSCVSGQSPQPTDPGVPRLPRVPLDDDPFVETFSQ